MKTNDNDEIKDTQEIHSEEIRMILDSMPKGIILWGTAVICVLFIALLIFIMSLKYPYGEGETIFHHLFIK